eukprot:scaffold28259_cov37-Phaeocystis_antarctica.AAC.2
MGTWLRLGLRVRVRVRVRGGVRCNRHGHRLRVVRAVSAHERVGHGGARAAQRARGTAPGWG